MSCCCWIKSGKYYNTRKTHLHTYNILLSSHCFQEALSLSRNTCNLGFCFLVWQTMSSMKFKFQSVNLLVVSWAQYMDFLFFCLWRFCLKWSLDFSHTPFWILLIFRDFFKSPSQNHEVLSLHWAIQSQKACINLP